MRVAFVVLLIAACSGNETAHSPVTAPVPPDLSSGAAHTAPGACAVETPEALLAAVNLAGEVQGELTLYSAQLDGQGERESVLSVRTAQREPDNPMAPEILTDHLVVFECQGGAMTQTVDWTFEATPDPGTIECEAGVRSVDVQQVGEREMLVVSTRQCQGSVDPRWDEQRMLILAYDGHGLGLVFSCAPLEYRMSGPCRSGAGITREVQISDDQPPTIHARMERDFDAGACEGEEPGPDETALRQEATYSWNGTAFVSSSIDVCR